MFIEFNEGLKIVEFLVRELCVGYIVYFQNIIINGFIGVFNILMVLRGINFQVLKYYRIFLEIFIVLKRLLSIVGLVKCYSVLCQKFDM